MYVLGLNIGSHDTSAALLDCTTGRLLYASEQERFNRIKHTKSLPIDCARELLKCAEISSSQIDAVSLGWNFESMYKNLYLDELFGGNLAHAKRDYRKFIQLDASLTTFMSELGLTCRQYKYSHHLSHHAHSYYSSGFKDATSICIDGYGDRCTASIAKCMNKNIRIVHEVRFPGSLGLFYSAITHYLGFKSHCDEGITMGLAPFGDANCKIHINGNESTYKEYFRSLIAFNEGQIKFDDTKLLIGHNKAGWVSATLQQDIGPRRGPGDPMTEAHKNIAAAAQNRLQEILLEMVGFAVDKTGIQENICLSGGVALNCVANDIIRRQYKQSRVYVPQSPGDSGVAIGSALLASIRKVPHISFDLKSLNRTSYGPEYDYSLTVDYFQRSRIEGLIYEHCLEEEFINKVVGYLQQGKIVGWFSGGSEFGPRALGHRSILSRPSPSSVRDFVNARVKFREAFRPFAPAILEEYCSEYFDLNIVSKHMLFAANYRSSSPHDISATVHVDGTARVQVVNKDNGLFYKLLDRFQRLTGIPVLLNTSFNVKGQPIVETPLEAFQTFETTNIDVLAFPGHIYSKQSGI